LKIGLAVQSESATIGPDLIQKTVIRDKADSDSRFEFKTHGLMPDKKGRNYCKVNCIFAAGFIVLDLDLFQI
jgi:hypothetical protein